jgi:antirestriction protein ArdC
MNVTTKIPYNGVNFWLASIYADRYGCPYFITLNQAKAKKARIKKSEFGSYCPITYWNTLYKDASGNIMKGFTYKDYKALPAASKKDIQQILYMKFYRVYNLNQLEDEDRDRLMPTAIVEGDQPVRNHDEQIEICEAVYNASGKMPEVKHDNDNRAFYSPSQDFINIPKSGKFVDINAYYGTLFHEAVHATGHETRLDREIKNSFGDEKYSKEELVAEMGSAFLCGITGISNEFLVDNSKAYIQNWISNLKKDKHLIYQASKAAEAATKFILADKMDELIGE